MTTKSIMRDIIGKDRSSFYPCVYGMLKAMIESKQSNKKLSKALKDIEEYEIRHLR